MRGTEIVGAKETPVCMMPSPSLLPGSTMEREANMRMIVSAPEMKRVLESDWSDPEVVAKAKRLIRYMEYGK